jgi:hypothetical protein
MQYSSQAEVEVGVVERRMKETLRRGVDKDRRWFRSICDSRIMEKASLLLFFGVSSS